MKTLSSFPKPLDKVLASHHACDVLHGGSPASNSSLVTLAHSHLFSLSAMPVHPLGSCCSQTGKCRLPSFLLPVLGSTGISPVRIFPHDPIHIAPPYPRYYPCCFLDSRYEPLNLLFQVFIHLLLVSPCSHQNQSSQNRDHLCMV